MNEIERRTEEKSNDVGYMKKYLKLALDIEADVMVWEDALSTHKNSLESVKNEIREFQNARSYGDDFEQTKAAKREAIVRKINHLRLEYHHEEKKRKRNLFIKIGVCVGLFLILTLVCYFNGVGEMLVKEMGKGELVPEGFEGIFEIITSALFPIFIIVALSVVLFLVPNAFPNYSDELWEEISKFKKQLEAVDQEEKQVAESNQYVAAMLPDMLKKQHYLEYMINSISYNLEESKKVRQMIYSEGVLPSKYQRIVCVASLYQFLANGICIQIKGHGGIYDTYEYHLKLKDIIDNLVEIRRDLRRIMANQEALYDKLCDVQETLENINSGISNMAKELSSNTAIAAEAAKRSAIAQEWKNREIWYTQ